MYKKGKCQTGVYFIYPRDYGELFTVTVHHPIFY